MAISTCAIGTEIVTRRATARIVVRQPRIAEQTFSELDLQWINGFWLGNRGDRLFSRDAVGIKQLIRRLRRRRGKLQAAENQRKGRNGAPLTKSGSRYFSFTRLRQLQQISFGQQFSDLCSSENIPPSASTPPSGPVLRHNGVPAGYKSLVENQASGRMAEADSGDCEADDISNHGSISRPARSASGGERPCRARSGHRVRPAPRRSF